jgi:HAMP domain-containing protein
MTAGDRFARLSTAGKLLLILTTALLPIGLALVWIGESGIRQANSALAGRSQDQARIAARGIESLIARNALALRIAANGALATGPRDACTRARRSLAIAPGVVQTFELANANGTPLCEIGDIGDTGTLPVVAPGAIRVRVAPDSSAIAVRVGVIGGMATAMIPLQEVRSAAVAAGGDIAALTLQDGERELRVFGPLPGRDPRLTVTDLPIGDETVVARVASRRASLATVDRLLLLLPVLMWVAAALITWLLVSRLLIRPLKRLERGVLSYQPGTTLDLPSKLGPSTEIQELRDAFARAVAKVDQSEQEMSGALEGQRRLVREVHHRV